MASVIRFSQMRPLIIALVVCLLSSCRSDPTSRIERLENDNKELKKRLEDSPKDYSEAQLKCLNASNLYLKDLVPALERGSRILNASNHYNRQLGKCFAFTESRIRKGTGKKQVSNTVRRLYDVYDQVYIGSIETKFGVNEKTHMYETLVLGCSFDNRFCDSQEDFMKRTDRYMKE